MPFPKTYIDAMLLNWGDRLFHEPLRHVAAPNLPRLPRRQIGDEAASMRERLARTVRRTPEVMVKITNRASSVQGMGAVRRHLRYISRNGRIELEDQDGQIISGVVALRDLAEAWHLGGWGIPEESPRREVFNVLLSMPPGTDRQAVREAARAFAAEDFGDGRRYVFAAHDDEAHPHVHLSVQVRGSDGRRLNPRKQDLQRWREHFARQLREHGVDANATPRRARGQTHRYPKQAVVHMVAREEMPRYWRAVPGDAGRRAVWQAHAGVFDAWHEIARAMVNSGVAGDRAMAMDIADFVQAMPVQQHRPPTVQVRAGHTQQPEQEHGLEPGARTAPPLQSGPDNGQQRDPDAEVER